jgi:hypothetical protein
VSALAIDLFCGLGGWTDGLLAEDYDVMGFDIENHKYGDLRYPGKLVLQDVRTLHGSRFKDAALIVASPPCQEYSYMAMPWKRAKKIVEEYRSGIRDVKKLNELFDTCFRIQREACEAAGHYIPMVVENVRGAQPWVGRARWNYGSYYLWGDIPALMPIVTRRRMKFPGAGGNYLWRDRQYSSVESAAAFHQESRVTKNNGGSWFNIAHNTTSGKGQNPDGRKGIPHRSSGHWTNPAENGIKQHGSGREWFAGDGKISRLTSSKSSARKVASAMIARIPFDLARYIASVYKPKQKRIIPESRVTVPG